MHASRWALVLFAAALGPTACAATSPDGPAALTGPASPEVAPVAPVPPVPPDVLALVYRRLAFADDMRDRYWIDEVFVPSERIAFNLDSMSVGIGADWKYVPDLRAFTSDEPPPWTEDIHGTGPVVRPETREIRVPAALVARIRDWVRAREALERDALTIGEAVDEARLLPPGVGSRWWRPDTPAK